MLKDIKTGKFYIKNAEFKKLQSMAACNGFVINSINDPQENYLAALKAMPLDQLQNLGDFIDAESSTFTPVP